MAYGTQLFTNNAVALLAAPLNPGDTTLRVMAGYGSLYPEPAAGQFFLVTLEDQTGTAREIIRVTGRVGDLFTNCVRGQEGTTARAWSASLGSDTLVDHRVTAETMRLAMLLPEGGVDAGPAGPQGPAGVKGDTGDVGPAGPAGVDGTNGVDGVDGANGQAGADGIQGPAGVNGVDGTNGVDGAQGPAGIQGPPGADGLDGVDGAQGPIGLQGPAGVDGINGANGLDGSNASFTVSEEGVQIGDAATSLNFVGDSVTVTGLLGAKTITITGNANGGVINGSSPQVPTNIDQAWTVPISSVQYSQYQRGFKFFVTIMMPINGRSCTFEVLGNVSGNLAAGTEVVSFNRTSRVGQNFLGNLDIILDTATKELDLVWQNLESNPVHVMCTRIQHLI